MDLINDVTVENRHLRQSMRDLVALSTLSANWTGLEREGIGGSLAEALLGMLSLDFVYICLTGSSEQHKIEVIRTGPLARSPQTALVQAAVAPFLNCSKLEPPASIPSPFSDDTLQIAVTRFGIGEDNGVLITGARRADFPAEHDRLLLGVGANQSAIVLGRLRTEADAQTQHEWLRVTLASIGDAVITTDAAGRVTYLNPVAQQLTGWSQSDANGHLLHDIFQIVDELTREKVESPVLRALATGVVGSLPRRTLLISRDGAERPIDDSAAPIRDKRGIVDGAVLVFRDVTERRSSEAVIRAREARYRVLVTATSDVVYLMNADWSEMQPLDGRDLVSSNDAPLRDWLPKNVPASDQELVREKYQKAIATEGIFELEHRVYRPDGSIGWTFSRAVPIRDTSGRVVEWFGTARDVTAERHSKESLARVIAETERQRRLYETILAGTPDFIYIFSLDHRVAYANDALTKMWGFPLSETIGKTLLEIGYEPWHAEMHHEEIDRVRATKLPIRGEVPFHGTSGRRIYDYIFVPVFGADGEVEAVAGTTRDITERKSMEDELRQLAATLSDADHRKDEFLATLAHELRNPLAPIRNGLQILKLAGNDESAAEQARAMMERQVDQMVRLVDDLMDVSRISRGKIELRRERVLLGNVLASAIETSRPLIEQMGHELTVISPPQRIIVDADDTRLAQVFLNLLNNAAKYSERGGRIWLTTELHENEAHVSIRDSGIGIPADQLPRIFEMFAQVDRSLEKSQGGLGIGLTLVQRIVEMHGGSVEARSEGHGHGSEFIVRLSVAEDYPKAKLDSGAPAGNAPHRILVVDDNRDSADSLALMLAQLGHETLTAYDGEQAIRQTGGFRPDVILLDIGLPKLNGYEVCRRIRQLPGIDKVLIIAQTGWGQEADRQRTHDAGFDHHLVKPVDPAALIALLAGLKADDLRRTI